jgi:hypothetical protein
MARSYPGSTQRPEIRVQSDPTAIFLRRSNRSLQDESLIGDQDALAGGVQIRAMNEGRTECGEAPAPRRWSRAESAVRTCPRSARLGKRRDQRGVHPSDLRAKGIRIR